MTGLRAVTAAGLLLLGACAQGQVNSTPRTVSSDDATWSTASPAYDRAFERTFTETPFENGALSVVATEDDELEAYTLVPCQDGRAICAGGPGGAAAPLLRTPDWFVVPGLQGRTFWLGFGGDGYVETGDRFVPLAWNARPLGTGAGDDAAIETPYRHD